MIFLLIGFLCMVTACNGDSQAENNPGITYKVTVVGNGAGSSGGGRHKAGDTVTVRAGTSSYNFRIWISTSAGVEFNDPEKPTTTFIMPSNDVMVGAFFDAPPVNLLKNAQASADSYFSGLGYGDTLKPEKAVDGNTSTRWASDDNTINTKTWLQLDMRTPQLFNKLVLTEHRQFGARIAAFNVSVSEDGENWNTWPRVIFSETIVRVINKPVMARYIRIDFIKSVNEGVNITEAEAYMDLDALGENHFAPQKVKVDFGTNLGAPDYKATGFLYGLSADGKLPLDPLLSDLKPKLFRGGAIYHSGPAWAKPGLSTADREAGYLARFNSVKAQYDRVSALGANYYFLLSDTFCGDKTVTGNNHIAYPGDNDDWILWENFLKRAAADKIANNMDRIRYDIWNEPESGYFWSKGPERYYQMWKKAVEILREADPNAIIVGPSYGGFNQSQISAWLDRTKADNVLPDILDWHFSLDPVADVEIAKNLLRQKNITTINAITIGEYILDNDYRREQYTGYTAWYIARLQKADIIGAIHAVWRSLDDGSLNDILTPALQPRGQWWVYKSYADITGTLLEVTPSKNIDGVAGINASEKTARILLGNNSYRIGLLQGDAIGDIEVSLTGLNNAAYLFPNGRIKVEVSQIPETSGALTAGPGPKQEFDIPVVNGAANFIIPWATWRDAYTVTITPYQ